MRGFSQKAERESVQGKLAISQDGQDVDDLREADRRKNEFLAILAHELRNPLASIVNAVALLRSDDAVERNWATDIIARQASAMTCLVDDLLDVSRIACGKIELRKMPLDLATILDEAVEVVRSSLQERGHKFVSDYPRGTLLLDADPMRVKQIVVNLLVNAIKFTPPGGQISLAADKEDNCAVVRVRDNGVGIESSHLASIFLLFAQSERSLARTNGGLGLGLTISRTLAQLHDGSIAAVSAGIGSGSEFVLRLPLGATLLGFRGPEAGSVNVSESLPSARILVVDDSVDSAHTLARLLTKRGHQVVVANRGPDAITIAKDLDPNMVILDIGLPEMDGYEVVRRLKKADALGKCLFIALTGFGQDGDRQESRAAGFDLHLVKPVEFEVLDEIIRNALRRRGPFRQEAPPLSS